MCMHSVLIGGEEQYNLLTTAADMRMIDRGYIFIPYDTLLYSLPYKNVNYPILANDTKLRRAYDGVLTITMDQGEQNFYEAFSAAQESYDIRTSTPPEEVTVIGLKNIRTELVFMFTLTRYYFKQAIQGWGIGKAICGKHLFHSRNLCSVGIYALHLTNSSAHTLQ